MPDPSEPLAELVRPTEDLLLDAVQVEDHRPELRTATDTSVRSGYPTEDYLAGLAAEDGDGVRCAGADHPDDRAYLLQRRSRTTRTSPVPRAQVER